MQRANAVPGTRATDAGLLLLRLAIGGTVFAHGALKLFGWFGDGGGLDAVSAGFEQIRFSPGGANAVMAGVAEAGGGVLLAVGLATPAAAAATAGTLVVAASLHAPNGFFFGDGGRELPASLALTATAIGITGAGRYSVDHLVGGRLDRTWMRSTVLALIAPAAGAVIRRRARALAARAATEADSADPTTESGA